MLVRPRPFNQDTRFTVAWNYEESDSDSEPYPGVQELRKGRQAEVEIPSWRVLETYKPMPKLPLKRPSRGYIKELTLGYLVEYDLDELDDEWLEKTHKAYSSKGEMYRIDDETLETTLDYLEKASFDQMEFEQTCTTSDIAEDKKGAEDLSLCCVCGKSSKKEDIVICVGCDISVHYDCAGLEKPKHGENLLQEPERVPGRKTNKQESKRCQRNTSCFNCKKNHRRCDGGQPACLNFPIRSFECAYQEESFRRRDEGGTDEAQESDGKSSKSADADEPSDADHRWMCDRCLYCPMKSPKKGADYVPNIPERITAAAKIQYKSKLERINCFSCGHSGGMMKKLEVDRDSNLYQQRAQHTIPSRSTLERSNKKGRSSPLPSPSSMKRREFKTEHDFVHTHCAMWIPKFSYDADGKLFMSGNEVYPKCSICLNQSGVIKCSNRSCRTYYHPSCALDNGQKIDICDKKITSFCHTHTLRFIQETKKTDVHASLGRFIDNNTKINIEGLLKKEIPFFAFDDMCEYWKEKRWAIQSGRKPLIGRLVEESYELSNGLQANLEKTRSMDPEEKYDQLLTVRRSMEGLRTLADLVGKREATKHEQIQIMLKYVESMFPQTTKEKKPVERNTKNSKKAAKNSQNTISKPSKGRKSIGKKDREGAAQQEEEEVEEEEEPEVPIVQKPRGRPKKKSRVSHTIDTNEDAEESDKRCGEDESPRAKNTNSKRSKSFALEDDDKRPQKRRKITPPKVERERVANPVAQGKDTRDTDEEPTVNENKGTEDRFAYRATRTRGGRTGLTRNQPTRIGVSINYYPPRRDRNDGERTKRRGSRRRHVDNDAKEVDQYFNNPPPGLKPVVLYPASASQGRRPSVEAIRPTYYDTDGDKERAARVSVSDNFNKARDDATTRQSKKRKRQGTDKGKDGNNLRRKFVVPVELSTKEEDTNKGKVEYKDKCKPRPPTRANPDKLSPGLQDKTKKGRRT